MKPFSLNIKGRLIEYDRPLVMGIVNVTPDSFFCGSRALAQLDVSRRVERMITEGVDIIDLGGVSTRPGARQVSEYEEFDRLHTGLKGIRDVSEDIPVSVDTYRTSIARPVVEKYGADIINDISGGTMDPEMFDTIASLRVPYILMHMRGTPQTMQSMTDYTDVTAEVVTDLSRKLRELRLKGVADVIIDPGFGFAKTAEQNFSLLKNLSALSSELSAPILVGMSRKSMLTKTLDIEPEDALNATTVVNTIALMQGASILRVHDVRPAAEAVKLFSLTC